MASVLIVDDEGGMRAMLAMALDPEGHSITEASNAEQALEHIRSSEPDILITDIRLPGRSGIELLQAVRSSHPSVECIVMTAYADAKTGIEAMKAGAFEYIAKPFEMDHMLLLVKSAAEKRALRDEIGRLTQRKVSPLDTMIASSEPMRAVIGIARMVATRDTTVLIQGPSGTGKELIARGIHAESSRGTFVPVNCGALPGTLLESELFGHQKGAFTGAVAHKPGLFELASGGTLFLDEIGEVPLALQVKLLRVLQEREFCRVGGTVVQKTDARVIAATNRDLQQAVRDGTFREDLYYRLNVFPIQIPPLSARRDDIPALVDLFMKKFVHTTGIEPAALDILIRHNWPGNVRELENAVERAVILSGGGPVDERCLAPNIREGGAQSAGQFVLPPEGISLERIERSFVEQALAMAGGNKSRAAELLGISRRAVYSKMRSLGIIDERGGEESEQEE